MDAHDEQDFHDVVVGQWHAEDLVPPALVRVHATGTAASAGTRPRSTPGACW
jgi:hypothetical protein